MLGIKFGNTELRKLMEITRVSRYRKLGWINFIGLTTQSKNGLARGDPGIAINIII